MKNVLEWLETTVEKYPDKPAFSDTECSITFAQVYDLSLIHISEPTRPY